MIGRACSCETDVQQAALSGRWTSELRAHAANCASCREVLVVASALSGDVGAAPRRMSPSILWAKARHARRQRAETVASRILVGSQVGLGLAGLGLLGYLAGATGAWSFLAGTLGSAGATWLVTLSALVTAGLSMATARWLTRHS